MAAYSATKSSVLVSRPPSVGGPRGVSHSRADAISRADDLENKLYRDASPVTHVTPDDAPTLLFHGDEDVVVPIKQSEIFEEALKKAGVRCVFSECLEAGTALIFGSRWVTGASRITWAKPFAGSTRISRRSRSKS